MSEGQGRHSPGRRHLADLPRVGVLHEGVPAGVRAHRDGAVEPGGGAQAVRRACRQSPSASRKGRHNCRRSELAERVVETVCHIDIAQGVNCDPLGRVESGRATRPIRVAGASSGKRCHNACRGDLIDRAGGLVGHIEVASRVSREPSRGHQGASGKGAHHPSRCDPTDCAQQEVCHIDIAGNVHSQSGGTVERGRG